MRSSRRGNLLLRNPLARGECAVRILFYRTAAGMKSVAKRPAAGGESCKAGFFVLHSVFAA